MLSEGRRDGLRLALSRSLSEPGVPLHEPPTLPPSQVVSMPCSPCADSCTLQRSLVLRRSRVLEAWEVARRLTKAQKVRPFVLVDLRPFFAFNARHIRGAINVNCCDRINRRRLQQKRASLMDLAASSSGREVLKKRSYKEVVVYDEGTEDVEGLSPQHPVFLVLSALLEEAREPLLLKGGFQAFEGSYPELCEDTLRLPGTGLEECPRCPDDVGCGGPTCPDGDLGIDHVPVTQVLPYLFLGNARDAQDMKVLQMLGISRVLSVTHLEQRAFPPDQGVIVKCLPAFDSGQQNLRQYFDEAIVFIDEARRVGARVLVHCQAGVSRSPTIVLAYLMKHTRMTMLDAYKLVKQRRPIISPNLNFMGQLVEWESSLQLNKSETECAACHQCTWQRQESQSIPNACHV